MAAATKRVNLASLASDPVEVVPGHNVADLIRVRPEDVARNPLNQRINFGTHEELVELGESLKAGQVQPIVVVRRAAFLDLFPEHEDKIGEALWVLIAGERRWRGAMKVTMEFMDALLRESFADSREAFVDAMFSENFDRKDLDPIEEAYQVEEMVALCGGHAGKAADRFRKSQPWISTRRALLNLTDDLQRKVRTGEIPVRIARKVARLDQDKQAAAVREALNPTPPASNPEPAPPPPAPPPPAPPELDPPAQGDGRELPAPPAGGPERSPGPKKPSVWDSPTLLANEVRKRFDPGQRRELVELLAED